MTFLFMTIALGCGGIGCLMLSNATMGAGIICLGCLSAVFARMAQARANHNKLISALRGPAETGDVTNDNSDIPKPNLGKFFGK